MERYSSYKNSGIEWIGKIPEHWNLKKLKYCVNKRDEIIQEPKFLIAVENIESGTGKLIGLEAEKNYIGATNSFKKGDVIFNKLRPYLAKVYKAERDGGCHGELLILNGKSSKIENDFLFYVMFSKPFIDTVDSSTHGTKMPRANWDGFIKQMKISIPPLEEQTQIANYLFRKTQQIDALIEKKERLISLLEEERTAIINQAVTKGLDPNAKMKDSGIDCLGEIPEDWDATKLRFLASIIPSNVDKKTKEGEKEVLLCNYTDVYKNDYIRHDPNFMRASASNAQIEKLSLKKHDVIVTKDSEDPNDIGVPALVMNNLEGVVCGYHLTIFRNKEQNEFGRFLFWFLKSKICSDYFATMAKGITRYALGTNTFKELFVPIPENEIEFDKISNFLENKTMTIQTTINKANQEIDYLKEYKTTLISEVVTGKIDVREEVF